MFTLANQFGGVSIIYNEVECGNLVNEEKLEELREDTWLEEVYGT